MELFPDHTLFIQIFNFLFLLFLLNIFLFRPIRRIMNQRSEEMASLEKAAAEMEEKAQQNEKGIEEGRFQARKEGYKEKDMLKGRGQEEEKKYLAEATASAEEKRNKAAEELDQKLNEVRKTLEAEVDSFSRELAEKVLGRSVS